MKKTILTIAAFIAGCYSGIVYSVTYITVKEATPAPTNHAEELTEEYKGKAVRSIVEEGGKVITTLENHDRIIVKGQLVKSK